MKKLLIPLALSAIAFNGCVKDKAPATTMTVNTTTGITWTSDEVTTTQTTDLVEIRATNAITRDYVTLQIRDFRDGKYTYVIENTGIGVNLTKSNAYAINNGQKVLAYKGKIAVDALAKKTMTGTFEFNDQSTTISGTFTASRP